MINILPNNKKQCCGCSACEQVCPQHCISIQEDNEGFLYPVVDRERCVECGLCEKVCPVVQNKEKETCNVTVYPKTIGGWHKDDNVRLESSSGGAFSLFAKYVLEREGVVFGCTLD